MLLIHWLVTPLLASQTVANWYWAAGLCFCITLGLWSCLYIAIEIEQPFGSDANDLPVHDIMRSFNRSLLLLASPVAQRVPSLKFSPGVLKPMRSSLVIKTSEEPRRKWGAQLFSNVVAKSTRPSSSRDASLWDSAGSAERKGNRRSKFKA